MSDRPLTSASVSRICILAIAGLAPAPLTASIQAAEPEPEEIVVSVERLSRAQARERAIAYVLRELYSLPLHRKSRQQRTRLVRALQSENSSF